MPTVAYRTRNGQISASVTADSTKDVFEQVSRLSEIFDAESACGVCGQKEYRYNFRTAQKGTQTFKFYELVCTSPTCGARFRFGQNSGTGELYPRRKAENGALMPNNGWAIWRGNEDDEEHTSQPQHQCQNGVPNAPQTQHGANTHVYHAPADEVPDYPAPAPQRPRKGDIWPGPGQCPMCHAPETKPHGRKCVEG